MLPHHPKRVLVFVATFIFGAVVVFLVVLVGSSLGLFKLPFFVSFLLLLSLAGRPSLFWALPIRA